MNENFRLYRRVKSRPSNDLRRKVLLKNFLREQMSSVPVQSASLVSNENFQPVVIQKSLETENVNVENSETGDQENSLSFSEESPSESNSTLVFDFSKITALKLSQLTHVKKKGPPLSEADVKRISKAYTNDVENAKNSTKENSVSITIDLGKVPADKFNELAMIFKDVKSNKEKRKKGVSKAKHVLKSIQNPFKRMQDKGKYLRDKIALKMKKFDESFKHNASEKRKNGTNSSEDSYKNSVNKLTFETGGLKFSIYQGKKSDIQKNDSIETLQDKIIVGKDSGNTSINTSCEKLSGNNLSSDTVKKASTSTSASHIGRENTKVSNTVGKKQRFMKECLINEVKDKPTFPKYFGKRSCDQDSMISRKKRKYYDDSQSQSIQTDISWSLHEIKKLERANKRLREENRLLSESLSSIMADVDVAFSPYQNRTEYDPYANSSHHLKNASNHSRENAELSYISSEPMRTRVSRSRSVQERAERRREVKLRLSSKSMCHRPYSRISPRSVYRAKPCIITNHTFPKESPSYQPNLRVLRSLPEHNYNVSLNRKSSMPERVPTRPVLRRRSSCVPEIQRPNVRCSLLSLPAEAFY